VHVLIFLGAAVLIVGFVIAYEKTVRADRTSRDEPVTTPSVANTNTDAYYMSRGLKPNVDPSTKTPDVPRVEPQPPAPSVPKPLFVGRADWNRYHRLDCKHVQSIPEEDKTPFASAEDAWQKGYIPCKVCAPPLPASASTQTPSPPPAAPRRTRTQEPVHIPVKDVELSFPFKIVEREVVSEKGVITAELTIEVAKPLQREDILKLAQKAVALETGKQKVNAVSMVFRTPAKSGSLKWLCWVDWAPYGDLVRAHEVKPGDYRTHKFDLFQQGVLKP
jgi:hypothetical protein